MKFCEWKIALILRSPTEKFTIEKKFLGALGILLKEDLEFQTEKWLQKTLRQELGKYDVMDHLIRIRNVAGIILKVPQKFQFNSLSDYSKSCIYDLNVFACDALFIYRLVLIIVKSLCTTYYTES